MSVDLFNSSLPQPDVSSSCSSIISYMQCLRSFPTYIVFTAFKATRMMLILPLCIFVMHHGFQQWKQRRSTSSASTMSHTDCFTYHIVFMELIVVLGYILSLMGLYRDDSAMLYYGILFRFFNWYGEMCFHVLTCLERYLAVAHPVIYLNLRNERGIRIRNVFTGCVWLLCLIGMGLLTMDCFEKVFSFSLLIFSLMTSSFCSLSVLCILIRPGPGKQGEHRKRVDPSKQRALYTLVAVSSALLLRFLWDVYWLDLFVKDENSECFIMVFSFLFNLPCNLVLPLLFLHRARKLVCCRIPRLYRG